MKKIAIFLAIIIIIISGISYIYLNYKASYNKSKKTNLEFEQYLNVEVMGTDLASVINRAIDNNIRNNVEKDNKGIYQNNHSNSINIEIKMIDDDNIYKMEKIYNGGIQYFVRYYGNIKFKCTKIEYHQETNKVKYMLFEQITQ